MTDTAHSKLIYNKFGQPVTDLRSDKIYIFGSSSKGNSVYFKIMLLSFTSDPSY